MGEESSRAQEIAEEQVGQPDLPEAVSGDFFEDAGHGPLYPPLGPEYNAMLDSAEREYLEEKGTIYPDIHIAASPEAVDEVLAKENAPEAEISLNPEALRVQRNASAAAIVERAVQFVRLQGSSTKVIVDTLEYKALREEVRGFMLVSYELQLEEALTRTLQEDVKLSQRSVEDPSPEPVAPAEETVPVADTGEVAVAAPQDPTQQ